jgi:MFS family permease
VTRRLRLATAETFRSLRERNFRLFFVGQVVSQVGTWVQSVALVWLVLTLTHSGVALGLTTALQFLPILVLGPWAGLAADRFDKRRLLIVAQALAGLQALVMGGLVLAGAVSVPVIYALTLAFGLITALDNPVRRSFVVELVDTADVPNAVGLNSALMTGSRVVGPALAGMLIAGVGVGWCFLVNALSYVAVLVALGRMDPAGFRRAERSARARGQLREGFAYVWRTPALRLPILLVAVISTFAFNYPVLLPLLAERTLHGNASTFTLLYSTMSVGSLTGALMVARRTRVGGRWLARWALLYAATLALLALAPNLPLALVAAVPVGLTGIMVLSGSNSTLQLHARPDMRGRVNALYSVVFLGSTPIGGPVAGWVAEHFGVRAGLGLGAVATALAAAAALASIRRVRGASAAPHERTPVAAAA